MKPITVWLCQDTKTKLFNHSHIEDGHITSQYPTVKLPSQNVQNSSTWQRIHAYINDGVIIKNSNLPTSN